LNLALAIIKKHVNSQPDLHIYTYQRKIDELTLLTYKARGITNSKEGEMSETNNFCRIEDIVNWSNKVVVDVGASLGATVVPFSRTAKKVYALEPSSCNYNSLLDQVHIRRLKNIKCFNVAASDFNGVTEFFTRESHGIHSLGVHNKGKVVSSALVSVVTLDDFWKKEINQQIGLLKIDVEGFETEVLNGASYLLKNKIIDSVIFEFSPRIHKLRGIAIDAPIVILLKYGYNLFTVDGKPFSFDKNNIPKICDLIALPMEES